MPSRWSPSKIGSPRRTDVSQGNNFWGAVDALRDRGTHIPSYQPSGAKPALNRAQVGAAQASMDAPEDIEQTFEAKLLRERVAEQQARIDELEATLTKREATTEVQRDHLATLTTEDEDSHDADSGLWTTAKR